MEHEDDVACHPLVRNDNFFAAINDEVATLIKSTFFCISCHLSVMIFNVLELAKVRTDHDRDSAQENLNRLLTVNFSVYFFAILDLLLSIELET